MPVSAASRWIKLTTPDFEIYTTNNEKSARAVLDRFEQARSFFLATISSHAHSDFPVRIIAFRSEEEYRDFRPGEGIFAYYLQAYDHDYIVMKDILPEHLPAAVHEYAHLVVHRMNWKLPFWLDEGVAEIYSTLEKTKTGTVVGQPLNDRLSLLRQTEALPLAQMLSMDRKTAVYGQRETMNLFYAQSWALVHMLRLSPLYSAKFDQFFYSVTHGGDAGKAFHTVYGKTLEQVQADLFDYTSKTQLQALLYDVSGEKPKAMQPTVEALVPGESVPVLAELLGGMKRSDQARQMLASEILGTKTAQVEAEECLGYLDWRAGQVDMARRHFVNALEQGSSNLRLLLHLSMITHDQAEARSLLERAVGTKPDYTEAQMRLALLYTNAGLIKQSQQVLDRISWMPASMSFSYYSTLARNYIQSNSPVELVNKALDNASGLATTTDQRQQIASLRQQVVRGAAGE